MTLSMILGGPATKAFEGTQNFLQRRQEYSLTQVRCSYIKLNLKVTKGREAF